MISLQQLELAINSARQANPSQGADAQLSPDVALLAGLYGRMIFYRLKALPLSSLSQHEFEAWSRWTSPHAAQTQNPPYPADQASDKP
ncbi:MAG: DUF3717 domain-containing protein [Burkholderiales bacterium]|jgi:hypothetical protein|nr:DUF3717 domain-containing protein [Burkholderiaceae bacterium]NBS80938.1 DUF3717 domain-containing protein [Betaproteobacteria bacterium]NBT97866.1 DUF3717 domain-containing protein [Betaproteobacteria bacterium]NCX01466.1 DUF3717 domain-containing protein [Betaproteobacteria bacterium]NDE30561.1 DUF3717 domain-containing protein [Betaproteobacteria bacterium]